MEQVKRELENLIAAFEECRFLYDGSFMVAISPDGEIIKILDRWHQAVFDFMSDKVKLQCDAYYIVEFRRICGDLRAKKVEWAVVPNKNIVAVVWTDNNRVITLNGDYAAGAIMYAQELGVAKYNSQILNM